MHHKPQYGDLKALRRSFHHNRPPKFGQCGDPRYTVRKRDRCEAGALPSRRKIRRNIYVKMQYQGDEFSAKVCIDYHLISNAIIDHTRATMSTTATTVSSTAVMTENSPHNGMSTRPPPSAYLTIDGLLRSHASEDDDIPMVGYPEKGVSDYEIHTAKTIDRYVDAACWWYQKQGLSPAVSCRLCHDDLHSLEADSVRNPIQRKHQLLHFSHLPALMPLFLFSP